MNGYGTALAVCTCGGTLCGRLDVERIVAAPGFASALVIHDLCLPAGSARVASWLRETAADSLVVAACGVPAAVQAVVEVSRAAGVAEHRTSLVDLREGCAWVHTQADQATAKALRMVASAAAGVRESTPPVPDVEVRPSGRVLVVGTGPGSLAAAARLKDLGCEAVLISGTLERFEGQAGEFKARIRTDQGVECHAVGAVIAAGDAPARMPAVQAGQRVAFLLEGDPWPSVTESTLSAALHLARDCGCRVLVLFRDMGVAGRGLEELYREARGSGVTFVRMEEGSLRIVEAGGEWVVTLEVPGLGSVTETVDVLVSGATDALQGTRGLAEVLGVAPRKGGWAPRERALLEPVATERNGVFLIGSARGPYTTDQAVRQGEAAAMAALSVAAPGVIAVSARASVDVERCAFCLTCLRVCPHQAVTTALGQTMRVLPAACQGCGVCAAACPAGAIQITESPNRRLLAEMDALMNGPPLGGRPTVVFACANSAVPALQALGRLRLSYPAQVLVVPVPCLGRLEAVHCVRPLAAGARRVLLCGCYDRSCEHLVGPATARRVVERASALAGTLGLDPGAIHVASLAPVDWHKLGQILGVSCDDGDRNGGEASKVTAHATA
ncbi:MAG: hydrogenase iron-sulfur subunit [bacterium]|nr:hydrogenase iron-sulfur subunit [bacterium]